MENIYQYCAMPICTFGVHEYAFIYDHIHLSSFCCKNPYPLSLYEYHYVLSKCQAPWACKTDAHIYYLIYREGLVSQESTVTTVYRVP